MTLCECFEGQLLTAKIQKGQNPFAIREKIIINGVRQNEVDGIWWARYLDDKMIEHSETVTSILQYYE